MAKFKNKKSLKNIKKQAKRRKALEKQSAPDIDNRFYLVSLFLFVVGSLSAFFHPLLAMLTILFPMIIGATIVDKVSRELFNKKYEYYNEYSPKQMSFSDILLTIPLLIFGLSPMFIIGEIADCYLGTQVWTNTVGYCR